MNNDQISKETKIMIVSAALMGFGGVMSETAMNVTFPKLIKVFDVDIGKVSWVTTVYLLGSGYYNDIELISKKKV
ncbi:hypothetical protein [Liquorilactobacillus uvarum]|uniref:hypothetical protein n=1 Tax=Liquorilactobacillus uvarum TaxID=303240 RepID=UPI00288A8231|nr:hypothetical protein [Liquorilactobacillus uvarum]